MCDYGAGMPGHISKTVLSAGGCHSALEAHANICQATTQRMKAMPSCPLSPFLALPPCLSLTHMRVYIVYVCLCVSIYIYL